MAVLVDKVCLLKTGVDEETSNFGKAAWADGETECIYNQIKQPKDFLFSSSQWTETSPTRYDKVQLLTKYLF